MFFKILRFLEVFFFYTGVTLGVLFVLLIVLWVLATQADGGRPGSRPGTWPELMDAVARADAPACGRVQ